MKSKIFSLIVLGVMLCSSSKAADSRIYVRGSANIADNDNGTSTLRCPSTGLCAVIQGNDIFIYVNNKFIHGTLVNSANLVDNGDGTSTLEGEVDYDFVEYVDELPQEG